MGLKRLGSSPFAYDGSCFTQFDHLRRPEYRLTREIIYQKRCIRASPDEKLDRNVVAEIPGPLLGKGDLVRLQKRCSGRIQQGCYAIELEVPPSFRKGDYSHILFGVATSYDRLNQSLPQFEIWLANSGARLLALITDLDNQELNFTQMTTLYRSRGIELIMKKPWNKSIGVNEQHFAIIRSLIENSNPGTKWLAIIDDDTFFPSLFPLSQSLSKHDHTTSAYLGALSENFDQVKNHGFMAFGGAGTFLSLPQARFLNPLIDRCLAEDDLAQGDGLLKHCISSKTKTQLSIIPGLHQLDMTGDLSGFYESGIYPVSLHHWKSWHHAPVDKMAKIVEFCGGCFLQRFKFGSDTVLSNGYSIAVYSGGMKDIDLNKTEGTWGGAQDFEWSLGPIRNPVDKSRKKIYQLIDSEKLGNNLRQIYVHRADGESSSSGKMVQNKDGQDRVSEPRDEVVELLWEW